MKIMNKKLLIRNIQKNKLISLLTLAFMGICAMLTVLFIMLFVNLSESIDSLMKTAQTPDFLQMHTGDIDQEEIDSFVSSRRDVKDYSINSFLNLENAMITIGDKSLADSTQDNGLCVQNKSFDFLLDMDNEVAYPHEGQVYVPVCYKNEYDIRKGSIFRVGSYELTVAGFIRDSQMNSMMASSKRFLVNDKDYNRLVGIGSEEYMIEFLLEEGADINDFSNAYINAKLPDNGPAITYPLIKMMNALSDGMMIFVILLVAFVVLVISIICIRYILMTSMEKDKKELGMLKALGISRGDITIMYLSKYIFLSVLGGAWGFVVALFVQKPLSVQMRELYGATKTNANAMISAVVAMIVAQVIILLAVRKIIRKAGNASAVEMLFAQKKCGNNRSKYLMITTVTALGMFLMLVPQNLYSTLSARDFVTYMGIGDADIRMDIRQCENLGGVTDDVMVKLAGDRRLEKTVLMQTISFKAKLPDGSEASLLTEVGDHLVFPVKYNAGRAPAAKNEIALSNLSAADLAINTGDTISLIIGRELSDYTVCGIYSDITNGGKTAKMAPLDRKIMNNYSDKIMWSIIYASLAPDISCEIGKLCSEAVTLDYQEKDTGDEISVKVVDIQKYVAGTYGQTIGQIKSVAVVSALCSCVVILIVILLFVRLLIRQERGDISLKKALGLAAGEIRKSYLVKVSAYVIVGIFIGELLGTIVGQMLVGLALEGLGASGFAFVLNPFWVFGVIPVSVLCIGIISATIGLLEVRSVSAYECCTGRE